MKCTNTVISICIFLYITTNSVVSSFSILDNTNKGYTIRSKENKGVSIEYLKTVFAEEVENYSEHNTLHTTIYELEDTSIEENGFIRSKGEDIICPHDGKVGAAFVDCLHGEDNVGVANVMLSYCWDNTVDEIIDVLDHFALKKDLDPKKTYVWICCLCNNQHRVFERSKKGEVVSFEEFQATVEDQVKSVDSVVTLMSSWQNSLYLTRMRCIYELYTAHENGCDINIEMPRKGRKDFYWTIHNDPSAFHNVIADFGSNKIENAEVTMEEERENILRIVEAGGGTDSLNAVVNGCIQEWIIAPRRSNRTAKSKQARPKQETKKRAAPKRKIAPLPATNKKKRKTNTQSAVDTSIVLGVVDPVSKINGTIEILDNEPCDCMLVHLDPTNNTDRFFILQFILGDDNSYYVYSRWGSTGASGQGIAQNFTDYKDAMKTFEKKFKEKTGLKWENRNDSTVRNKYRVIKQNFAEKRGGYKSAKWQYWVDDGIDGKRTGWYDYDESGSRNVEQLFQENLNNARLTDRLVDSGVWTYHVDLNNMTQTNVKHPNRTSRHIRRNTGEDMDDNSPPITTTSAMKTKRNIVKSANKLVAPTSALTKSKQALSAAAKPISSTSQNGTARIPVDTDIDMYYPGTPSSSFFVVKNNNDQWYDVVLNQCNITGSSNNNKYHRLQLLESTSTGNFHVWFKWGRVGESSTGRDLKGPFATEAAALKVFSKKYRDKTKNAWGDDDFVTYTGKYTRIEIDYEVEVKSEFKTSDADDDVEYLKSELDPKTRELVEVLFSKEMRDNALTSFNLDLKKLPLGVPSQQQIQNGVSILNEIEDKLNGGDVSDSYAMLSSQFYTAIPHSFGRRRPPVISTQSSLQDRYDMCNILLDMFSTNETLRQVAANTMKKQVPYPADSHYETLKADLSPIGTKTKEYKVVEKYFNETKSSGSSSKLLDVWSVDREGESKRHKGFDKVDNRRLLWHGTNIAVAAPIITSGLRIMPHSGGRVGSGIYLAAMQEKSAQYTSAYGAKFACMFLCEAALGKSHQVTSDGHHASSLKKAPSGFNSVHAVGSITPKSWTTTDIEGNSVEVPKTKAHNSGVSSSFHHDEFLVYDEAQVRLRYVVTVRL